MGSGFKKSGMWDKTAREEDTGDGIENTVGRRKEQLQEDIVPSEIVV